MSILSKSWKKILWAGIALLALFFIGVIYSLFFRPVVGGGNSNTILLLILGLVLGAAFMFLLFRASRASKGVTVTESSHTIVESMKKVFKIVCAEGYFSEIYDYKENKKLFSFIPAQKRALVIVKAKVLIGFDFAKFKWETDEEDRKVKLVYFPEPEILSIEPDYRYYSIEDELFYKFSSEDFMRIQQNSRQQVQSAALQSDLTKIASEQMKTLLTEVIESKSWKLENTYLIPEGEKVPELSIAGEKKEQV